MLGNMSNIPAYDINIEKTREEIMPGRLIIDGNAVYEIDEECMERQKMRAGARQSSRQGNRMVRCQNSGRTQAEKKQ